MFKDDIRRQFEFSLNANLIQNIYQESHDSDDELDERLEREICRDVEQRVTQLIIKQEDVNLYMIILQTIQEHLW